MRMSWCPFFEKAGPIWDLRLMVDPLSGQNRGYAFITFCGKEAAQEAVKLCDSYEIRPVNTLECAFLWQITGFLLDQFRRIRLKKTFWKNSVKSQRVWWTLFSIINPMTKRRIGGSASLNMRITSQQHKPDAG